MQYVKEVNINEAVVHVLDFNSDEAILTNQRVNLNENNYKFLLSMIHKCLKREDLQYAKFKNSNNSLAMEVNQYFNGKCDILDTSKLVAEKMFNILCGLSGAASGDLFVVNISTEYGPMIAILKSDFNTMVTHDINFHNEQLVVDLNSIKTLPKSQKVSVAAFIKHQRIENEFDLMVLAPGGDDYEDKWFEHLFEYETLDNERDQTKKLLEATEQYARRLENAAAAEKLRNVVRSEVKNSDTVIVNEIIERAFEGRPEVAEEFQGFILDRGIKEKVKIDQDYIEHKKRNLNLDFGPDMKLKISQEAYNDMSRFQIIKNEDGSINVLIKNIEYYLEK